ncbi:MAG: glycoside hydrolase family 13 protein, partial [Bacilli bacterium]|nr:glycoside hydrolase family 13 protein [Bacilli bacterium]
MDPNSWKLGVDSSVSSVYVEPMFPKKGEQVTIRIQTGTTDRVHTVRLVSFQLGREKRIVLHKVRQSPFSLYEGSVKVLDDPIYWYFMIQA